MKRQGVGRGVLMRLLAGFASSVLLLIASALPGTADEFRTPAISAMRVEWRAVVDQFRAEIASRPGVMSSFTFATQRRVPGYDPRSTPGLVQLNAITERFFPGIGQSTIPVLLPFDTAAYVDGRMHGVPDSLSITHYQAGFRPAQMFQAGEAGYDAVFSLDPDAEGAPKTFARPVEIQITGSMLVYDIEDPFANKGEPVRALASQFPDLRRVIREGYVRYMFTRFGVPYVVSAHCLDSTPRPRRLACREAYPVIERFMKALRIAGGQPSRPRMDIPSFPVERPAKVSPDFTYRPPGDIIAGSGYRGQSGHADFTVYSQIRFPLEKAPAYANSQAFLNWGDCFHRGRVPSPSGRKGAPYHCKSGGGALVFDESAGANYTYPWQDNFCEARDFGVGQCPTGFGHQGQDIRPSSCPLRNDGADRCESDHYAVVAVRDGVVIRTAHHEAATLLVNTRNEHIRFRYMHMNPREMDADGLLDGRRVSEGEKIGLVSNYMDYPGGTTTHLHFDVQVFTREGWLWVNPYVTLISAYERLIGARGREVDAGPREAPANAGAPEESASPETPVEGGEN